MKKKAKKPAKKARKTKTTRKRSAPKAKDLSAKKAGSVKGGLLPYIDTSSIITGAGPGGGPHVSDLTALKYRGTIK